ncbi:MAG: CD1871A family CXXC motif-containing protein [Sphaerochaeta sp.]
MSKKNIIRLVIFLIALVFIAAGIFREETKVVLTKARDICLSCIGIG